MNSDRFLKLALVLINSFDLVPMKNIAGSHKIAAALCARHVRCITRITAAALGLKNIFLEETLESIT